MKKADVKIGKVYMVTVSGNRARVRLTNENPDGGWDGLNLDTNRKVRVKTAGRLQMQIADPDAPASENQPEPETADTAPQTTEQQPEKAPQPEPNEEQEPEALDSATVATQAADTPPEEPTADQEPEAGTEATSAPQDKPLTKLTVEELQAKYAEVIQRPTSSTNKAYLVWKLREAAKGRIPIGSRPRRTASDPGNMKVLPLRMDADLVSQLDEARERLGLPSRMELFRLSLHAYLLEAGEVRVAELFAPTTEA